MKRRLYPGQILPPSGTYDPNPSEPRREQFPTISDTNRAVQPQKMARGLKFRIEIEEVSHNP